MVDIFDLAFSVARSAFRLIKSLGGSEKAATKNWVVLQHSPRLIVYQGSETYVTVTLFSIEGTGSSVPSVSPDALMIQLVRRGWRAGLFGWSIARWLGAQTVKGIDVTPQTSHSRSSSTPVSATEAAVRTSFPEQALVKWDKDITRFESQQVQNKYQELPGKSIQKLVPIGTYAVRIPAQAGDGYFRLSLRFGHGPYAIGPDFRVYSLSLSSASPRGAALLPPTLAPELVLRTVSTMLYTFLLGLVPVAAIMEKVLPRGSARKIITWLYRTAGFDRKADRMMEQYNVQERITNAKESILETVPFSSAGIRTEHDLQKDAAYGRGGVTYWR